MLKRITNALGYSLIVWFVLWVLFYTLFGVIVWIITDDFEVKYLHQKISAVISGGMAFMFGVVFVIKTTLDKP